tara:strand:+ start:829 stop:1104 length:276 start_codon:yes stop_codon:yes gene_type:complete
MEHLLNSNKFLNSLTYEDRKYFFNLSVQDRMEFIALVCNVSAKDLGIKPISAHTLETYEHIGNQVKQLVNEGKIEIEGFDKNGVIIVNVLD